MAFSSLQLRLSRIREFLQERSVASYLVGGFVRDSLLHRTTADIDIALNRDALEIGPLLADRLEGKYVLLDASHQICRIVLPDASPSGLSAHLYIDLSTMNGDISQDLARRDFTINAMACELNNYLDSPAEYRLIDPFEGRTDLCTRRIIPVNPQVFQDDPARLMRAFRLAAELDFKITVETEALIRRDAVHLMRTAGERIREELLKILATRQAGATVRAMDDFRLLTRVFPELEAARDVEQPHEHHWDVLNHSIESVSTAACILRQGVCAYITAEMLNEIPWSSGLEQYFNDTAELSASHAVLLKLAALLHDIAKPETRTLDNQRIRFFGHNNQGADLVNRILERLRFSHREIRLVESMVRHHMRPTQMSRSGMPTRRAVYRYFRDTGNTAIDVLFLSLADHLAARGPELVPAQWQWHLELVKYVLDNSSREKNPAAAPPLINGHDLIRELGLTPGPQMRVYLEAIKEARAAGEVQNKEQALSYIKNRLRYKKQIL